MFKKTSAVHKKGKIKRRVMDPSKIMLLKQLALGLLLFTVLGLLLAGVWYGTRLHFLTIADIEVTGGETIPHEQVKKIISETIDGTYMRIIPRRFAWFYPYEEIMSKLAVIPRLKDPILERDGGTKITLNFSEYEPHALWCKDRESRECLFIDSSGYAFSRAPKLSGGAFLRYRTLGREMKVGTTMAERNEIETMEKFITLVEEELNFSITQIETDITGDVFYILAGGGEFKATLKDEADKVFDNLRTILASKEFSDVKPGNFQYIDLRFGNKVFVNEEMGDAASSTEIATSGDKTTVEPKPANPPNTTTLTESTTTTATSGTDVSLTKKTPTASSSEDIEE